MAVPPEAPDTVTVQHPAPGAVVVRVSGEVDLVSVGLLERVITEQLGRQPERIVIDLTEVRFLATPGLAALINAANYRPDLQIVATGPIIARALRMTGLDEWFNLSPTVTDALGTE